MAYIVDLFCLPDKQLSSHMRDPIEYIYGTNNKINYFDQKSKLIVGLGHKKENTNDIY